MKIIYLLIALIFAPALVPAANAEGKTVPWEMHTKRDKEPGKPKRKVWGWICIAAGVVLFVLLRLVLQKLIIFALLGLILTGVLLLIL